jgi:hypothetical protein
VLTLVALAFPPRLFGALGSHFFLTTLISLETVWRRERTTQRIGRAGLGFLVAQLIARLIRYLSR